MFKRTPMPNGLDAWRRTVRIIEETKPMHFEELRRQVQQVHTRPIKDLESIPTGVAQFETLIEDYEAAGGTGYESDLIKKADLFNILPARLLSDLLWRSTRTESFAEFRDHII